MKLASPVTPDADDQQMLRQVVGYYHETLKHSPEALRYLQGRGLTHPEMLAHFQLGFANRTLGYTLPKPGIASRRRSARAVCSGSASCGNRATSTSTARSSCRSSRSRATCWACTAARSRQACARARRCICTCRGRIAACGTSRRWKSSKEIILCEALIDALTFWCAGFRNVTASYGVNGFTDDHRAAFRKHGVERVRIAYDRDEAGDNAALALAEELMGMGIECFRVLFPKGMDANEYALKVTPAAKSLEVALNKAQWLGKGKPHGRTNQQLKKKPMSQFFP